MSVSWSVQRGQKSPQVHSSWFTKLPVPMRLRDTPVPIPNTMVKTQAADGTILETIWENRWLPDSKGLIAQPVRAHA